MSSNIPNTPVATRPVLAAPAGWRWRLLGEVARLESGHTPSRRETTYWEGGHIPWLSLRDIKSLDDKRVVDTFDMPTQAGIDNSSARVLPADTVALCRTASVGKVAILGRAMATSQDFVNWVCGPDILPDYLYWALIGSGPMFEVEKQGSTHKTIYMPTVERFQVLLPPLTEQRRIAAILDEADVVRRKRRKAIALLDDLLRATFLDMFGDPVTNPRRWQTSPLGELVEVQGGLQVTAQRTEPLEVPYLRVANVHRERLDLREIKSIRVTTAERERVRLRYGDVLVVEGHGNPDEVGRSAVWDRSDEMLHQNHLIRVRTDPACLDPWYLSAFLNSPGGRRQMMRAGKTTSGLNTISTSNVKATSVLLPPLRLQRRWSDFVRACSSERRHAEEHAYHIDKLFSALLLRTFSGVP